MRSCGACTACCTIGEIPEISKPARTPCPNLCGPQGGCSIYADRPPSCAGFFCEWLKGAGGVNDRPDQSGVMVSINDLNGGVWVFVLELWQGAARSTGACVIMDVASRVDRPVIVVNFDSKPPHDYGDYTIIKESLNNMSKRMRGKQLGFLDVARKFGIYELVAQNPDGAMVVN